MGDNTSLSTRSTAFDTLNGTNSYENNYRCKFVSSVLV